MSVPAISGAEFSRGYSPERKISNRTSRKYISADQSQSLGGFNGTDPNLCEIKRLMSTLWKQTNQAGSAASAVTSAGSRLRSLRVEAYIANPAAIISTPKT